VEQGTVRTEDRDLRAAASPGATDDVGLSVACEITGRRVDAAGEARGQSVERFPLHSCGSVEDSYQRAAAGAGCRDDLGSTIAGQVGSCHAHSSAETSGHGKEIEEESSISAAEDLDLRPAAPVGTGDDVAVTVAVYITSRHIDAAGELRHERIVAG